MKILRWLAFFFAGLIVVILTTLRFFPDVYVSIANYFLQSSHQRIETDNLQVQYFPLQILTTQLLVLDDSNATTLEAKNVDAGVKFWSALKADEPYWWLIADGIMISPDESSKDTTSTTSELLNFESLLSFSELSINNLSYGNQQLKVHLQQTAENIAIDVSHPLADIVAILTKVDQGYQLSAQVPSIDFAHLTAQAEEPVSSTEKSRPPEFGFLDRWRLNASLRKAGREAGEEWLEFEFVAQGFVRVPGLHPFRLELDLEVQEVHNSDSLGFDFYSVLPLQLSSFIEAEGNRLKLGEFDLQYLASDIGGQLQFDLGAKLAVAGFIQSSRLQLPKTSERIEVEEVESPTEEQPLFGDEIIDWSWLDSMEVDVSLHADRFDIGEAPFENLEISVKVTDGMLVLGPLKSQFGEGGFEGALELTHVEGGVELSTNFNLHGVELESFGFVPKEELVGGATDIVLSLESSGTTFAGLAAGLQGDILLMVQGATVQNDTFELFGSDVFMETFHKLNPFSKSDPTTELECALVHFEVVDGVLKSDKQLVIETTKMEIVGNGSINLKDESIDIGISPSSREGIGVNVGSLIKFMKLGGTLRNPAPQTDALGVLQSGAAIGAAVSTGGVSVLAEGLLKRISNAGSACERQLEKTQTEFTETSETPG